MKKHTSFMPIQFILPLFGVQHSLYLEKFLGTCFFVGKPPILITAYHVISEWNQSIAIYSPINPERHVFKANIIYSSKDADLSLLEVPDYFLESGLLLEKEEEIVNNQLIACYEFSQTLFINKTRELNVIPTTRIGNITKFTNLTDRYGKAGEDALEISFPALLGSSGAPIMNNENKRVLGIMKSNVDYHLLPAQTIIFKDGNKSYEETNYMLPQGIAINVKHLYEIIKEIRPLVSID
jgi:hypothetical protein